MNIQVIKSRRRTIGIEVHADGKVIVRTPLRMSSTEINRFIDEHEDWIRQKLDFVSRNQITDTVQVHRGRMSVEAGA